MTNDKDTSSSENKETHDPSRRKFMKNSGLVAGGLVGGSLLGGMLTNQFGSKDSKETDKIKNPDDNYQEARQYFTRLEDFRVLSAATECIYPKDDSGPGAIELGVPYFIDKQLAGAWGMDARDYRQGPFIQRKAPIANLSKDTSEEPTSAPFVKNEPAGEVEMNQSRLTRREIFTDGLRKMNEESDKQFKLPFYEIEEEQQVEILKGFESGKIQMLGVASQNFFTLLRRMTIEGAFADPLYGGNKNMAGWKMKEYPGPQPSYANIIEEQDFIKMDPISLNDYQGH